MVIVLQLIHPPGVVTSLTAGTQKDEIFAGWRRHHPGPLSGFIGVAPAGFPAGSGTHQLPVVTAFFSSWHPRARRARHGGDLIEPTAAGRPTGSSSGAGSAALRRADLPPRTRLQKHFVAAARRGPVRRRPA